MPTSSKANDSLGGVCTLHSAKHSKDSASCSSKTPIQAFSQRYDTDHIKRIWLHAASTCLQGQTVCFYTSRIQLYGNLTQTLNVACSTHENIGLACLDATHPLAEGWRAVADSFPLSAKINLILCVYFFRFVIDQSSNQQTLFHLTGL